MRRRFSGPRWASGRSNPLSLIRKYFDEIRAFEEMISSLPYLPRWIIKIVISLKYLTDLVGVLFILMILIVAIGWLLGLIL